MSYNLSVSITNGSLVLIEGGSEINFFGNLSNYEIFYNSFISLKSFPPTSVTFQDGTTDKCRERR